MAGTASLNPGCYTEAGWSGRFTHPRWAPRLGLLAQPPCGLFWGTAFCSFLMTWLTLGTGGSLNQECQGMS